MNFRELLANEIEVRVGQIYPSKGVTFLLYKNARTDANILDETVGAENWQDKYYEVKGNLFCSVGIKCGDEWVFKDDCGTESYTEKEKGEASDAFKRACFRWGIGRELYTSPLIFIKPDKFKKLSQNDKGKWECKDRLRVKWINVEDGKIVQLVIFNENTKEDVFKYGF